MKVILQDGTGKETVGEAIAIVHGDEIRIVIDGTEIDFIQHGDLWYAQGLWDKGPTHIQIYQEAKGDDDV